MLRTIVIASGLVMGSSLAAHAADVSQAADFAEFTRHFCAKTPDKQHIFVVPASVFTDQSSVDCDGAVSTLRTSEPSDDPGHIIYNIDPPEGVDMAYDCDGKADVGITLVALNCLPASMESMDHPKN
ncbi:hypothetical protein [Bauldia sp.]|uniref:hypothetical protein n=1 Tax=Bauldia sp. TaxID=2575872 RepID=UPI003BA8633F